LESALETAVELVLEPASAWETVLASAWEKEMVLESALA
jgi:hypothetical protein